MLFVPNAEFRRRAREVLKPNLPTALLVALIATLPSLLPQVVAALTGADRLPYQLLSQAASIRPESLSALLAEHQGALQLSGAAVLLSLLLSPVLTLGQTWFSLRLLRHEAGVLTDVFARLGAFFKALGLSILTALYVILWELPGVAVTVLSTLWFSATQSSFALMLFYPGMMLMLIFGVRAALRVSQADLLLADDPSRGVIACMRESRRMMQNRLVQFLALMLSFIGWYLLLFFLDNMLYGILGPVVSSTLSMLLQLVLGVYMQFTVSAFYLYLREETQIQPEVTVE